MDKFGTVLLTMFRQIPGPIAIDRVRELRLVLAPVDRGVRRAVQDQGRLGGLKEARDMLPVANVALGSSGHRRLDAAGAQDEIELPGEHPPAPRHDHRSIQIQVSSFNAGDQLKQGRPAFNRDGRGAHSYRSASDYFVAYCNS
jgi:hypothetical protein